ncbi:MAG: endonuclease MutS2 [Balneolia bacterium]|nr:endonuclease MutS2 [Balneolia bacterium]
MLIYPQSAPDKLGYTVIKEATADYIRSEMGSEELHALQPVSQEKFIRTELELMREMMDMKQFEGSIPFDHPYDIREAARRSRVKRAILDPETIFHTGRFCATCRNLKNFLKNKAETHPVLARFSTRLIPLKELEKAITDVISDTGNVKDNATPALRQIRKSLASRKNDLRSTLDRIIRQMNKDGLLAEFEATIRNGRMVIPVRAEHKRKISGFVQDVSATGQTVYLEPAETLHINNDIRELEQKERQEIERILMELTALIGTDHEMILSNSDAIGKFDLLMAKASLCMRLDCSIPEISESGPLQLVDARNPVLYLKQMKLKKESREPVVPLNMKLIPEEKGVIITGPNAGGKSVSLKTAALMSLMMQSGYAIPADASSVLPVYSGLFLDMGDEQSIDNDLSTFSSRLTWMLDTCNKADAGSLILVDEAGTGTDPEEGVSLFQAFLELMYEKGATIIATTHHGNLKVFAHNHPGFVNASMEFDSTRLTPTYHFQKGLPGSSYAFEISQRLGLPSGLLSRARELVGDSKNRLESLILDMEAKAQEAGDIRRGAEKEKVKTEKLMREYEQRLKTLTSERDKLREKALTDAQDIMKSANARIEEAIRRIYEAGDDKEKIKEIRAGVDAHRKDVDRELRKTSERRKNKGKKSIEPPKPGDTVRFLDSRSTGELMELNGNQAVVEVNGLRLKTKYKNLEKATPEKSKKKEITLTGTAVSATPRMVSPSLDIRGYRGDDAVKEVMHYLDQVSATSLKKVEIIHGKGDGILKKLVHEELGKRKDVKGFEFAPWEQGGPGCTIAEMK